MFNSFFDFASADPWARPRSVRQVPHRKRGPARRVAEPRRQPQTQTQHKEPVGTEARPTKTTLLETMPAAERVRKLASSVMVEVGKLPQVGVARLERGQQLLAEFCDKVSQAGLSTGTEETKRHCSEFCGWIQTNCFDGITADEHGAAARARSRALNKSVERLCRDQEFHRWAAMVCEESQQASSPAASTPSEPASSSETGAEDGSLDLSTPCPEANESASNTEAEIEEQPQEDTEEDPGEDWTLVDASDDEEPHNADTDNDVLSVHCCTSGPSDASEVDDREDVCDKMEVESESANETDASHSVHKGLTSESQTEVESESANETDASHSVHKGLTSESQTVATERKDEDDSSAQPMNGIQHPSAVEIIRQSFPELTEAAANHLLQAFDGNMREAAIAYGRSKQIREHRAQARRKAQELELWRQAEQNRRYEMELARWQQQQQQQQQQQRRRQQHLQRQQQYWMDAHDYYARQSPLFAW